MERSAGDRCRGSGTTARSSPPPGAPHEPFRGRCLSPMSAARGAGTLRLGLFDHGALPRRHEAPPSRAGPSGTRPDGGASRRPDAGASASSPVTADATLRAAGTVSSATSCVCDVRVPRRPPLRVATALPMRRRPVSERATRPYRLRRRVAHWPAVTTRAWRPPRRHRACSLDRARTHIQSGGMRMAHARIAVGSPVSGVAHDRRAHCRDRARAGRGSVPARRREPRKRGRLLFGTGDELANGRLTATLGGQPLTARKAYLLAFHQAQDAG